MVESPGQRIERTKKKRFLAEPTVERATVFRC